MALKQIKNKIISTKKTGKVTKAMESVSAVKMRKSQERAFAGRPYIHSAMKILERLADTQEGLSHPLSTKRQSGKNLLVIVTSDKGLAGSVNSAVLKQATEIFAREPETDVIAIGRKAVEFTRREKKVLLGEYTNITDGVTLPDVYAMSEAIMGAFVSETYRKVEVIYQNFVSTFDQTPITRHILPLDPKDVQDIMRGIKPKVGKFSDNRLEKTTKTDYIVEPSTEVVLDTLVPQLVEIIIYHALLESKASEHSARMVAMKNATDKSKEVVKELTVKFNKARQAAITAEVSEITAGVEALK